MEKFKRKLNKFIRSPKLFFKDAGKKITLVSQNNKPFDASIVYNTSRDIVHINYDSGILNVNKVDRHIKNEDLSSLIFISNKTKHFNKAKLLGDILKNVDNFIGFREKYFFLGLVDDEVISNLINIRGSLELSSWRSDPFPKIKNIFIVDPLNDICELIRGCSQKVSIHGIFTERFTDEVRSDYDLDTFMVHHEVKVSLSSVRSLAYYSNTKQLLEIVKSAILAEDNKNIDMLVPASSNCPYIEDIEKYNSSRYDVIIILVKKFKGAGESFSEMLSLLESCIDYMLVRNSIYRKYHSCIVSRDMRSFLCFATKDGLRFQVIEK